MKILGNFFNYNSEACFKIHSIDKYFYNVILIILLMITISITSFAQDTPKNVFSLTPKEQTIHYGIISATKDPDQFQVLSVAMSMLSQVHQTAIHLVNEPDEDQKYDLFIYIDDSTNRQLAMNVHPKLKREFESDHVVSVLTYPSLSNGEAIVVRVFWDKLLELYLKTGTREEKAADMTAKNVSLLAKYVLGYAGTYLSTKSNHFTPSRVLSDKHHATDLQAEELHAQSVQVRTLQNILDKSNEFIKAGLRALDYSTRHFYELMIQKYQDQLIAAQELLPKPEVNSKGKRRVSKIQEQRIRKIIPFTGGNCISKVTRQK